jgi:hypothetical protein
MTLATDVILHKAASIWNAFLCLKEPIAFKSFLPAHAAKHRIRQLQPFRFPHF